MQRCGALSCLFLLQPANMCCASTTWLRLWSVVPPVRLALAAHPSSHSPARLRFGTPLPLGLVFAHRGGNRTAQIRSLGSPSWARARPRLWAGNPATSQGKTTPPWPATTTRTSSWSPCGWSTETGGRLWSACCRRAAAMSLLARLPPREGCPRAGCRRASVITNRLLPRMLIRQSGPLLSDATLLRQSNPLSSDATLLRQSDPLPLSLALHLRRRWLSGT